MVLTAARSGIARSAATRANWTPRWLTVIPCYALSQVARSAATRSNYTGGATYISIGGSEVATGAGATRAIADTLQISERMDEGANTAAVRVTGAPIPVGAAVSIRVGSKNQLAPIFAGRVLSYTQGYHLRPANPYQDLKLIDHTWPLNTLVVTEHATGSATTIVQAWLAKYAAAYSAAGVTPDLPVVEGGITVTNGTLPQALTQLAKRVGCVWFCDYQRVIHFTPELTPDPLLIPPFEVNAVNPSFEAAGFSVDRDLSQIVTRVYVEGGGANTLTAVVPGETILPVSEASWYEPSGTVVAGPQRITYTSRLLGGGGSLVGPGAAPTGAPGLTLAGGAGLESGTHAYAVAFRTASGLSLVGPPAAIVVGAVPPPIAAPTAEARPGAGPSPGTHVYAVTWATSSGETPPGPTVSVATGLTPPPTGTPGATLVVGAGVDDGLHDYAVTFVTATGETTPSPISAAVSTGPVVTAFLADPTTAPTPGAPVTGPGPDAGSHRYAVTFRNAAGETAPGPMSEAVTTGPIPPPDPAPVASAPTAGGAITIGTHRYAVTAYNAAGETFPGPLSNTITTEAVADPTVAPAVTVTGPDGVLTPNATYRYVITYVTAAGGETRGSPPSPAAVTTATNRVVAVVIPSVPGPVAAARVYRTMGNGSVFYLRIAFPGSSWGTFYDGAFGEGADGSLVGQPPPPSSNTTPRQTVTLTLPIGPTGTTGRRIYRSPAGSGGLKELAQISNNTATSYIDNDADSALGASPPSVNTAFRSQVTVSALPVGPSGTVGKRLYRTRADAGTLQLLAELTNTTSSYVDTVADSALGAEAPTSNSTAVAVAYNQVRLSLPIGGSGTLYRRIYRRSAGAGLRLLAVVGDNATILAIDSFPNSVLGAAAPAVNTATTQQILLTLPAPTAPLVTSLRIYGSAADLTALQFIAAVPVGTATYLVTTPDASLGAAAPITNTATANQVDVSSLPVGAATVLERYVYRTAANASALQLLVVIPDNTTTTFHDAIADAALGAAAPSSDLSGLTQPTGVVLPGAVTLPIASTRDFAATGGWAPIGNGEQVVRYTGLTGQALTGLPAVGPGALTASISYGSTVTPAPHLAGIPASGPGAIRYAIPRGDPVNLWLQIDDPAAQALLASLVGGDGILEDYLQDRRLAPPEARARGTAHLLQRNQVNVTVRYRTHDRNTTVGARVVFNLGPPTNLQGEFTIQSVTIGGFDPAGRHPPTYTVEASSQRFSFDDLLRLAREPGRRW